MEDKLAKGLRARMFDVASRRQSVNDLRAKLSEHLLNVHSIHSSFNFVDGTLSRHLYKLTLRAFMSSSKSLSTHDGEK